MIDFAMCVCNVKTQGLMIQGGVLVRAFAGDEARPLSPVLGEDGPLGVAEWQAKENEPPLQRPAVAHFCPGGGAGEAPKPCFR